MPSVLNLSKQKEVKKRNQSYRPEEIEISGYVYDDLGEPLPGATVKVVGLNVGTVTNIEGYFKIGCVQPLLIFWYLSSSILIKSL